MYRRPLNKDGSEDNRYPENWNRLRHFIFKRDGYRCQRCGHTTDLVCHHIVPVGRGGNNHPNNLLTLCKRCHNYIHQHNDL